MRFQELRDVDGIVLAQGLHPAIAVVAAGAAARAAAITAVVSTKGCKVLRPSDIEDELKRAAVTAVEQHDSAVEQKKGKVAEAEKALTEASDAAQATARETTVATADLARFDDLASRLAFAEESYESAVRADAEAARSLAAALGELDRILGQRHSASTSLEQARKSRDNRGVPEAVLQQAMNLQAALAKAEADKHEAVQQADDTSQAARAASRDALVTLETAHTALRSGMALISSGPPIGARVCRCPVWSPTTATAWPPPLPARRRPRRMPRESSAPPGTASKTNATTSMLSMPPGPFNLTPRGRSRNG